MCGTRGSNPPKPHYYHLFIHSIHLPNNYLYLSNFIYQILFIEFYLSNLFIYLFIYLFIVPRLFEEKRRDIVFGFPSFRPSVRPSFRPSVRPSVRPSFHPSFRPPIGVCTLCAQLLLQFYSDSFETLQMSSSCFEDVHVVWI